MQLKNDNEEVTIEIIKKYKWIKPTNSMTPRKYLYSMHLF